MLLTLSVYFKPLLLSTNQYSIYHPIGLRQNKLKRAGQFQLAWSLGALILLFKGGLREEKENYNLEA